jgi:hypothetical protein
MFRCKGNKNSRAHGLHIWRVRWSCQVAVWGEAWGGFDQVVAFVEAAQFEVFEVERPLSVADGLEADLMADQRGRDLQVAPFPFNLARAANFAFLPVIRITAGRGQAFRVVARGGLINFRRCPLSKGLLWALLVVLALERIESLLLLAQVGPGRLRGGGLERAVHPFVPSVLLRTARLDALQVKAEPHPPHGQLTQTAQGDAGKGRPVVGADGPRRAVLPERRDKRRLHRPKPGRSIQALAAQQVPAVAVADRQRRALLTVSGVGTSP